jgi:hypothetical protein
MKDILRTVVTAIGFIGFVMLAATQIKQADSESAATRTHQLEVIAKSPEEVFIGTGFVIVKMLRIEYSQVCFLLKDQDKQSFEGCVSKDRYISSLRRL